MQFAEPVVNYSKSILMMSNDYIATMIEIAAMFEKASKKAVVIAEREERKRVAAKRIVQWKQEKSQKQVDKLLRQIQAQ